LESLAACKLNGLPCASCSRGLTVDTNDTKSPARVHPYTQPHQPQRRRGSLAVLSLPLSCHLPEPAPNRPAFLSLGDRAHANSIASDSVPCAGRGPGASRPGRNL